MILGIFTARCAKSGALALRECQQTNRGSGMCPDLNGEKEKNMCTNLLDLGEGVKVACRKCDECTNSRLQTWVARGMAEKTQHKYCWMLTLTYSNETEEHRRGASSFRYSDVRAFIKRLARQMYWHGGHRSPRFLVTGEMGSKRGRVHWHMLLFTDCDLRALGEWKKHGKPWFGPREGKGNRLNWSMWPWGFVENRIPDDNGMAYVLKYAFKDQFTPQRAKGTSREWKQEDVATGLFRQSKGSARGEAIGEPWLYQHVRHLFDVGQCPVGLSFKVPNYWGYWFVSGAQRENLIDNIKKLVLEIDREPPQLRTFLLQLSEAERDRFWGIDHGQEAEQERKEVAQQRRYFSEVSHDLRQKHAIRRNCGGKTPCSKCIASFDQFEYDAAERASYVREQRNETPHPFCRDRYEVERYFEGGDSFGQFSQEQAKQRQIREARNAERRAARKKEVQNAS